MSTSKALPLLLLLACGVLLGQTGTPVDCTPAAFTFTSATTGTAISNANTATPCRSWEVTYNAPATLTALSIRIETSPDNSSWTAVPNTACNSTVPAAPPCVIDGANPSTTTGNQTFSVAAYGRYVRLNVTVYTGSGTLTARMYGYKGLSARSGGAGAGGGGANLTIAGTANEISATGAGCTPPNSGTCTIALIPVLTHAVTFDGGGVALSGGATREIAILETGTLRSVRVQACNGLDGNSRCNAGGTATIDIQTVSNSSFNSGGCAGASSIKGSGSLITITTAYGLDGVLTGYTLTNFGGQTVCIVLTSPTAIRVDVFLGVG